jgi:hypothetical protein
MVIYIAGIFKPVIIVATAQNMPVGLRLVDNTHI